MLQKGRDVQTENYISTALLADRIYSADNHFFNLIK